jgi:hypothetical protein
MMRRNVGGACCDGLMTKCYRRGRQGSRRSLTAITTPNPLDDPPEISNRYTEEVRWEILLLEPVSDWFLSLCKDAPAIADKIEQAIDELAIGARSSAGPWSTGFMEVRSTTSRNSARG